MSDLDAKITEALDALTSAMWMSGARPDEIEDAITEWRDRAVNDEGRDEDAADVIADVITDAFRQAVEHRTGHRSVRIVPDRGTRFTFTWHPDEMPMSREFEQLVLRATKDAVASPGTRTEQES